MNKKEKTNIVSNLPDINKRILDLVNHFSEGNKTLFAEKINIPQQNFNRIFNIDKRTKKYPKPSDNILKAIYLNLPEVNRTWVLVGEGHMFNEDNLNIEVKGTDFSSLPIEEKLNSIYDLLINSSTDSNNSVESLIHGLVSKDAHQDKYINFMRDKIIELESSLESQKNMTIQILEIVKDLKLSAH